MLYIFGGLPGTGKSSLSAILARKLKALHLRIDTIEQAIRDSELTVDGPVGYTVGYRVTLDNLRLGLDVIADSVNPLHITRNAWREVAREAGVSFVEIEVICSNRAEHRHRVESRLSNITRLRHPTWQDVLKRTYEPWKGEHLVIDTAGQTLEESTAALFKALQCQ